MFNKNKKGNKRNYSKKSQVATEYLVIFGIALAFLIPISIMYLEYSKRGSDNVLLSKVDGMSDELSKAINTVYTYGEGSDTIVLLKIPAGIEKIQFSNREVLFKIKLSGGKESEIVKVVAADLTPCSIEKPLPGTHKLTIRKNYRAGEGIGTELISFIIDDKEC